MKKNNLENLYREKLKDFSEIPDERVWKGIEASLDKRKKKRVAPIWWQLGGVAALLAVLFYIINPISNDETLDTPIIVNTPETELNSANDNDGIPNGNNQNSSLKGVDGVANMDSEDEILDESNPVNVEKDASLSIKKSPSTTDIASNSKSAERLQNDANQNKGFEESKFVGDPNPVVATIDGKAEKNRTTNTIQNTDIPKNEIDEAVTQTETEEEKGKKSIFEAIEEQKDLEKEALASNDLDERWSLGPSVAPVYFNSFGQGSPIHSNFAGNSKSGNVNLSFGLNVNYKVSKKLSLRSGIHRVNYGYDTNDIVFTSSLAASDNLIDNIDYDQASRTIVVENSSKSEVALADNAEVAGEVNPLEGSMVQELGYIEVPMELNYALLDKKFGINIIGGISSLFLVDNAVSLESDDLVTEMGEANNANDVNFSTNIGLGLNYKISPKVQLNLEPMFKYQLNTFSDTAGDFNPYSIGVYSGLNFKF